MTISLENIQLRPPAFFQALTEAVQRCIDSFPKNPNLTIADRIQQVTFQLADSPELKALQALIENQFGYKLSPIRLDTKNRISAEMLVAVTIPAPKKAGAIHQYDTFLKTLSLLAGQVDYETGEIASQANYSPKIQTTISTLTLLLPEYYPDLGIGAAEIAAVILHELGHCYDYISIFQRGAIVTGLADQLNQYLPTTLTEADVIRVASDCRDALTETKGPKRNELIQFTKELPSLMQSVKAKGDLSQDTLRSLIHYITSVTSVGLASLQVSKLCSLSLRFSPIFATDELATRDERTADAFSARYGAAKYLVRFLQGYHYFVAKYKTVSADKKPIAGQFWDLQYKLAPWQILQSGLNVIPLVSLGGYDNDLKRMTEICNALYGGLKSTTIDPATRDYYIGQIDEIRVLIKKWEAYPDNRIRHYLYGAIGIFVKAGAAAFQLFTDDLATQYEKLQLLTKDYVDNPLFYQGARLAKLAESR